jgi:hypothetical protein
VTATPEEPFRLAMSRRRAAVAIGVAAIAVLGALAAAGAWLMTAGDQPPNPAIAGAPSLPASTEVAAKATAPAFGTSGTVTLWTQVDETATSCAGRGQYQDIAASAAVVVTDVGGAQLAAGHLGPGRADGLACVLEFTVVGIPTGVETYQLHVGKQPARTYSEADLRRGLLEIALR